MHIISTMSTFSLEYILYILRSLRNYPVCSSCILNYVFRIKRFSSLILNTPYKWRGLHVLGCCKMEAWNYDMKRKVYQHEFVIETHSTLMNSKIIFISRVCNLRHPIFCRAYNKLYSNTHHCFQEIWKYGKQRRVLTDVRNYSLLSAWNIASHCFCFNYRT